MIARAAAYMYDKAFGPAADPRQIAGPVSIILFHPRGACTCPRSKLLSVPPPTKTYFVPQQLYSRLISKFDHES